MIRLLLHTEIDQTAHPEFFEPLLLTVLATAQKESGDGQISLALIDNKRIRSINKKYRHQDKVTDVLSFLYSDPENTREIDGEIFISTEKALSQAQEYEQTFCTEMARLFVHGIIHLLGIDHEISERKEEFFDLEEKALDAFWEKIPENTKCIQ